MQPTIMTLAELVKIRRDQTGLTQREVGKQSTVSRSTINGIENGDICLPSPEIVRGLATVLPVTVAEMVAAMGYVEPDGTRPEGEFFDTVDSIGDDLEEILEALRTKLRRFGPQSQTGT